MERRVCPQLDRRYSQKTRNGVARETSSTHLEARKIGATRGFKARSAEEGSGGETRGTIAGTVYGLKYRGNSKLRRRCGRILRERGNPDDAEGSQTGRGRRRGNPATAAKAERVNARFDELQRHPENARGASLWRFRFWGIACSSGASRTGDCSWKRRCMQRWRLAPKGIGGGGRSELLGVADFGRASRPEGNRCTDAVRGRTRRR